jgi:hypothetical protein
MGRHPLLDPPRVVVDVAARIPTQRRGARRSDGEASTPPAESPLDRAARASVASVTMRYVNLTLNDLILGLRDLDRVRLPAVTASRTVELYAPRLRARLAEIEALPSATTGGEPFAIELAAKDLEHDGHGGAIWFFVEAILRSPMAAPALKATLTEVRARFIPELAELKRPHADEAAAAVKREPDLAEMAKALRAVRLPDGVTLYDWVAAFLAAGKDLDALLKKRASAATGDRSQAGTLRGATVGQLNRFRAALEDEFEDDAEALARIDNALFAYIDELEKRRVTPAAAPTTPDGPTPPTPV